MRNYQRALSFYQRAVQFDPYHRDAILGIAASAQLLGDYELAEQHFRRLLSLEPQDTAAFSGLLNLPSNNGGITELELQQHARQHGSPAALFAILGNYLARNVRWSEAESAYATALKQDAGNADYLFNYAVVLDNLARHRESIHYYSRALEAASAGSFSFDRQSAEKRLESLTAGS
jgi:tetratricopeptide (TPR) repeat protein